MFFLNQPILNIFMVHENILWLFYCIKIDLNRYYIEASNG